MAFLAAALGSDQTFAAVCVNVCRAHLEVISHKAAIKAKPGIFRNHRTGTRKTADGSI